jgi:hypothetical protein
LKFLLLFIASSLIQAFDEKLPPEGPFPITPKVFHHPEKVLFNTRPYNMDLFVDFDEEEIESASVFIKTNAMESYIEFRMNTYRARYRHAFNPLLTPATTIEYFFVVILKDDSIYAAPLDKDGYIIIVKHILEDPAEYFKRKLAQRR